MPGDSVRVVPHIPPVGLREVEETCIVCGAGLESASVRYPLRVQFSEKRYSLASLIVGYACRGCHRDRRPEVRAAQFVAAQRYLHVQRS